MARYDVHRLGKALVLNVQASLLDDLATRVVIPLIPEGKAPRPIGELNPVLTLQGERYVLLTQALATVPLKELEKTTGSLDSHHDEIAKALDLLLTGF
jgi:toxin CcdB